MKIRQGFVSNSSSSSFIIKKDDTIDSISSFLDYNFDFENKNNHFSKEIIDSYKYVKNNKIKSVFLNIYDFYGIKEDDEYIYAIKELGSNINAYADVEMCLLNQEIKNKYNDIKEDYIDGFVEELMRKENNMYNFLDGNFGRVALYYDYNEDSVQGYCSDCKRRYWMIDGEPKCPKCGKDQYGNKHI